MVSSVAISFHCCRCSLSKTPAYYGVVLLRDIRPAIRVVIMHSTGPRQHGGCGRRDVLWAIFHHSLHRLYVGRPLLVFHPYLYYLLGYTAYFVRKSSTMESPIKIEVRLKSLFSLYCESIAIFVHACTYLITQCVWNSARGDLYSHTLFVSYFGLRNTVQAIIHYMVSLESWTWFS